jgi:RNA polymerase sigma factor (sigma-70 family)
MIHPQLQDVVHHLRHLTGPQTAPAPSERELLDRFIAERDEAAFAALVERRAPMVLGVCRRVLRHAHDAEDACQATFRVLARKAASVRKRESLASWLHGVAYHVSTRLKRDLARRGAREALRPEATQADVAAEVSWRELRGLLEDELARLPARYRSPLILCYLEGKTRDEAAQQLGWSLTTFRGRLERGRERLRARLIRRGLTLSAALFAGALGESSASAAPPPAFVVLTVKAALLYAAGQVTPDVFAGRLHHGYSRSPLAHAAGSRASPQRRRTSTQRGEHAAQHPVLHGGAVGDVQMVQPAAPDRRAWRVEIDVVDPGRAARPRPERTCRVEPPAREVQVRGDSHVGGHRRRQRDLQAHEQVNGDPGVTEVLGRMNRVPRPAGVADEDDAARRAFFAPRQLAARPAVADAAQVFRPVTRTPQESAHLAEPAAEDDGVAAEEEDAVAGLRRVGVGAPGRQPAQPDAEREWPEPGGDAHPCRLLVTRGG